MESGDKTQLNNMCVLAQELADPCLGRADCSMCYLAVLSSGCRVPTSFLTCMATLLSSSLSRQRRLMKEVGYPTIFSASDTTLLQSDAPELENRLSVLCPRLAAVLQHRRDHVLKSIFSEYSVSIWRQLPEVSLRFLLPSSNGMTRFN